ncbi:MAG: hypothetical protein ACRCZ0_08615 [Cetobacterium sp.]
MNLVNFKSIIEEAYAKGEPTVYWNIGGEEFSTTREENGIIFRDVEGILGVYYIDKDYTIRKSNERISALMCLGSGAKLVLVWYGITKFKFIGSLIHKNLYRIREMFPPVYTKYKKYKANRNTL